MLQALSWAALGTGFTFLMTTLGAAVVFFFVEEPRPQFQRTMLGFAAGVMVAASIWSLLLPAMEQSENLGKLSFLPAFIGVWSLLLPAIEQSADFGVPGWLPAAAGLLLGVGFLSALDAVLPHLRRAKDMDLTRRQSTLLMAAITLHNVPEGMAVGLAFALAAEGEGMAGAAALALGIGIQNLPEGAAISLPLRQEGSSRGRAFLLGTLSGSVEPIFGILVVLVAAGVRPLMPWLLSFAAGAMLYVVVEELVPQAHSKAGTCGFVGGFLIMMILDVALG